MGARMTGKSGGIFAESSKTAVSSPETLTDAGDHKTFSSAHPLWDSELAPVIKVNGSQVSSTLYTINYITGVITFAAAVGSPYTVTANGYSYSVLTKVGDLSDWSLDAKVDTADATGFEDAWHVLVASFIGWVGTIGGYKVNGYWFDAFITGDNMYFKFYADVNTAANGYFIGNGHFDYSLKVVKDAAVKENMPIKGNGQLAFKTS